MKLQFRKLQPSSAFIKLFGTHSSARENKAPEPEYEFYYKRGHTYYFRSRNGEKLAVSNPSAASNFVRGQWYAINSVTPATA